MLAYKIIDCIAPSSKNLSREEYRESLDTFFGHLKQTIYYIKNDIDDVDAREEEIKAVCKKLKDDISKLFSDGIHYSFPEYHDQMFHYFEVLKNLPTECKRLIGKHESLYKK